MVGVVSPYGSHTRRCGSTGPNAIRVFAGRNVQSQRSARFGLCSARGTTEGHSRVRARARSGASRTSRHVRRRTSRTAFEPRHSSVTLRPRNCGDSAPQLCGRRILWTTHDVAWRERCMRRVWPNVAVSIVVKSANWHMRLLAARQTHRSGAVFDQSLDKDGEIFRCLHHWPHPECEGTIAGLHSQVRRTGARGVVCCCGSFSTISIRPGDVRER